jgi:hypothetical protein
MGSFWIEVSTKAFSGSWGLVTGWDTLQKAFLVIGPIAVGLFIYWSAWGRTVTIKEYVRPMAVTAGTYAVVGFIIFGYQLIKTPYSMREEERSKTKSVQKDSDEVKKELEAMRKPIKPSPCQMVSDLSASLIKFAFERDRNLPPFGLTVADRTKSIEYEEETRNLIHRNYSVRISSAMDVLDSYGFVEDLGTEQRYRNSNDLGSLRGCANYLRKEATHILPNCKLKYQ